MTRSEIKEHRETLKKTHWQILVPRLILGAIFTVAGLNGFLNLLPDTARYSTEGIAFIDAMKAGGFYTLLNAAELIAGVLLLFNFAGQLGVVILVPVCLGIVTFHSFLSPQGSTLAWIAFTLEVLMIIIYRKNFVSMFRGSRDPAEVLHRHHEHKNKTDLGDWVLDS
ncbi:MAG: DoxX family protein [Bdellovibrionota bacterium]